MMEYHLDELNKDVIILQIASLFFVSMGFIIKKKGGRRGKRRLRLFFEDGNERPAIKSQGGKKRKIKSHQEVG